MKLANRINKLGEYLSGNFFDLLLYVIGLLNILPLLAPIFAKIGWYWPSKIIYTMYSFFCHQLSWRSFHVCDHQYGWCARCTAIWFSVLVTGILVKVFHVKKVKWYWLGILMVPMALDGVIQTIATLLGFTGNGDIYYMSNTLVRFITGTMFGTGFGLWIWTTLKENVSLANPLKKIKTLSGLQLTLVTAVVAFIFFILALIVWKATSPLNGPANFWDFAVKTPILPQEFLIRAKDAI